MWVHYAAIGYRWLYWEPMVHDTVAHAGLCFFMVTVQASICVTVAKFKSDAWPAPWLARLIKTSWCMSGICFNTSKGYRCLLQQNDIHALFWDQYWSVPGTDSSMSSQSNFNLCQINSYIKTSKNKYKSTSLFRRHLSKYLCCVFAMHVILEIKGQPMYWIQLCHCSYDCSCNMVLYDAV